jgi:hypothetical protein
MKAKALIAFVCLTIVWASLTAAEYDLAVRFGISFDVFVSVFALIVVLGALFRAPEGYEDDNGFHIGVLITA